MSDSASSPSDEITGLLLRARAGESPAVERLFEAVYGELRQMARGRLRLERVDHTLNATALVHEAYLKLVDQQRVEWQSRGHFFAVASEAMRRILVNHARARGVQKRGGGVTPVPVEDLDVFASPEQAERIEALDEALQRLQAFDERGASVVTWRYFGGMSHDEIATVLGVSEVTVRRSWAAAKAWLRRELTDDPSPPLPS